MRFDDEQLIMPLFLGGGGRTRDDGDASGHYGEHCFRRVPVRTVFQSDGAPHPFSRRVRAFSFLIGIGGPIFWPYHSPDLTTLDFSLGFIKDTVYREKLKNVNMMRDRIVRAADCVTNETLVGTRIIHSSG
jgi:hypothetical protein